jgi:hypothetical protein
MARIPPLFRDAARDQASSLLNRLATDDLSWSIRHTIDDDVNCPARINPHTMGGPFADPAAFVSETRLRLAITFFLIILYGVQPGTALLPARLSFLRLTIRKDRRIVPVLWHHRPDNRGFLRYGPKIIKEIVPCRDPSG